MSVILTSENLFKRYPKGTKAVDGISFSLNRGEIFGFPDPDGAGKTTTVKLLMQGVANQFTYEHLLK